MLQSLVASQTRLYGIAGRSHVCVEAMQQAHFHTPSYLSVIIVRIDMDL